LWGATNHLVEHNAAVSAEVFPLFRGSGKDDAAGALSVIPHAVFSDPEIASVGLLEEEA
jgi:pyruvate/2-oxoglutarate dehydrogenase complex dihydrolipoamide dehydrogenase (E3) component